MSRAKSNWLRAFNKVRMQLQEVRTVNATAWPRRSPRPVPIPIPAQPGSMISCPPPTHTQLHGREAVGLMGRSLPGLSWPHCDPLVPNSLARCPQPSLPLEAWTFQICSEQNWRLETGETTGVNFTGRDRGQGRSERSEVRVPGGVLSAAAWLRLSLDPTAGRGEEMG